MKIIHVSYLIFDKGNGITTAVINQCYFENQVKDIDSKIIQLNELVINKKNELYDIFNENKLSVNLKNRTIFNLFIFLYNSRPDIVYFHNIYEIKTIILAFFCKLLGIKYIVIPHSSLMKTAQKKRRFIKKIYTNTFVRFLIGNSSALSFLNESEMNNSLNLCPKINRVTVPNGVKKNKFKKKRNHCDKLKILYFGRYDINHKGIDIFLNYVADSREFLIANNISINMYGSGDIDSVRLLVKDLSLELLVSLNGPVFGTDKDIMYRTHDIFVLTSRYEGLPITVLEALSYGMPCILSENTNMKDCINKGAAYRSDTSDEFFNALNLLCKYENYSTASLNGFKFIDNNYSWNKIIKDRINICRNILHSKNNKI